MKYTDKLGLKKPGLNDYVNIGDLNDNMDILDGEVGGLGTELDTHKAEMTQLIKIKKNTTILSTDWIDDTSVSGYWIYEISDVDITADTVVDINIHLADLEKASDIKPSNLSELGKVTLYADDKIEEDIICDMKLIRQVI